MKTIVSLWSLVIGNVLRILAKNRLIENDVCIDSPELTCFYRLFLEVVPVCNGNGGPLTGAAGVNIRSIYRYARH